ncbi:hypothetical protein DFS34DRAFT_634818 [Phlyctochytrium arcticum]|nr:hypothetical protein DFS34DRAFT_634818 [Phlyctochytrium arcticum]
MLTLGSGVPLVAVTRRQMLYSRIAYVYSTANATLQSHVKAMQTFDTLFRKTVRQVQDLQLVSRGYRLGSERRVESDVEHRRCGWLREMLAESLLGISDLAVSSYGQLLAVAGVSAPGTNNNNNSNIGGGAGPTPLILELPDPSIALAVESPTTPPLPDSQLQHQQPQTTHTLTRAHMHIKSQRIQILDALVLSSSFTGSPSTLSRRWNQINAIVRRLTRLYEGQTGLLLECADASLSVGRYKSSRTSDTRDTRHSSHDPPALQSLKHQTINSLASLDDILREMRAKILLCAQDLRDTSSISELTAKCSVLQSQFPHDVERLTSAFSTLQSTFQQSPTLAIDAPPPPLPPQRQIGDMYTHLEGVRDCAEDTTLLTVAGVFEDISGPTTEKPIPRSDRIKARNEKRVGDVKRKQDKMARDSVIVELRNVLDLRRVV